VYLNKIKSQLPLCSRKPSATPLHCSTCNFAFLRGGVGSKIVTITECRWRYAGSETCNQRRPTGRSYRLYKTLILGHRLSDCNKNTACLPRCVIYPRCPFLTLTRVSISAFFIMPTTMSSDNTHSTGFKVSTFLRDEKNSCKQLQKKILSESNLTQSWGCSTNADKSHRRHADRHTSRQELYHPGREQRSKGWRSICHSESTLEREEKW
jgi:hypothetical protein